MKKRPIKRITRKKMPRSSGDLLVTQKFVYGIRDELIEKISSSEKKFKSNFHGLKSEIHDLRSEIEGVKSEIHDLRSEIEGVKSEIHDLRSEIEGVKSEIHELRSEINAVKAEVHSLKSDVKRILVLVEEQANQNKITLDYMATLFERQDRLEKKVDQRL